MLVCLLSAFVLRGQPLYAVMFHGQLVFYAMAVAALAWPDVAGRFVLARLSGFFLLVNLAAGKALLLWLAGVRQELWEPTRRPT
jgi:hypothetical protein